MDFTFQWEWAYLLSLDASRDPVEFKDWAVLPISDHGGLDHLSESWLFGRGHQKGPEGVDVPWTHCRCRGWLVGSPSRVPSNSWLTATGSTAFSYALERWYAICIIDDAVKVLHHVAILIIWFCNYPHLRWFKKWQRRILGKMTPDCTLYLHSLKKSTSINWLHNSLEFRVGLIYR